MLIITRKKDESLIIGDDIEITVLKLEDGSVKLGINAPRETPILRKELYEAVREENKKAMNIDLNLLNKLKK
ncbi:carbon storage regulator CsrA [Clostridium taeniosporum]|uniref:Translational regulator CsrA n=1 Tax=Clostridium taeniosporum TaxID=394958 RepID=A0A1D7XHW1_9CLOT|nr:carbon storage regulator CsrA [Clostridium taeniosporum]AOR22902.1 carbon storage regulator [Clostridium taeniosporum]